MAAEVSEGADPDLPLWKLVVVMPVQCAVMIALGVGLWWWSGRPLAEFIAFSGEELAAGVAMGGALIVVAFLLWRLFPRTGEKLIRMQLEQYRFLLPHVSWPLILLVSLCAGLGEEALFRAGLQTALGDHIGMPGAIAVSAALFAVIHLGKPVVTALIFLIGCLFGVIYWQTGSLLVVALGHALYDVWALRYLHSELMRLGLIGNEPAALANAPDPV